MFIINYKYIEITKMKVEVKRIFNCSTYCISHVYIDGKYICDGIEDTDRMLDNSMDEKYIKSKNL